jgi:hypothetical protein
MAEIECSKTAIRRQADTLSGRMYRLREVAHLAAFAVEARRTLEGVYDALEHHPEFEKLMVQQVEAHRNWSAMEDTAGSVLQWVAQELRGVDDEMVAALYAIADGKEVAHG